VSFVTKHIFKENVAVLGTNYELERGHFSNHFLDLLELILMHKLSLRHLNLHTSFIIMRDLMQQIFVNCHTCV